MLSAVLGYLSHFSFLMIVACLDLATQTVGLELVVSPMKRVFSHPNSIVVGGMASLLGQARIETEIRNDILGGASGEIAPGETWVELWVTDESQAEAAALLIKQTLEQPEGEEWVCRECQESNPATFELCWHCGQGA